ncbi:hypothetical protein MUK42_36962 [Musa troglodytarum]|uniref:Uncharacterized protein n=1 Tax=Musa troglodytarum TaxID=320322 RepID=A0A9E7E831_9LILI|nr:hypothetical protein MUK42_36962 [Musa troglodytarum]
MAAPPPWMVSLRYIFEYFPAGSTNIYICCSSEMEYPNEVLTLSLDRRISKTFEIDICRQRQEVLGMYLGMKHRKRHIDWSTHNREGAPCKQTISLQWQAEDACGEASEPFSPPAN